MKRAICIAGLCAVAFVGAGCGDEDNDTLSYDDTGTEISAICESIDVEAEGLNGKAQHDAPILETLVPAFDDAIQEVRDLDVNEELASIRDDFADNADQQLALIEEAQVAAETGDTKAYRKALEGTGSLDSESNELANDLGADGCLDEG